MIYGSKVSTVRIDESGYFLTLPSEAKAAVADKEPAAQLRATELAGYILRVPPVFFPFIGQARLERIL